MTQREGIDRRGFLSIGAGAALLGTSARAQESSGKHEFKLKYAPHAGMFRELAGGGGGVDEIRYCADRGFRAFEDNGLARRSVQEQEAIGKALADRGMTMGVFVGNSNGFGNSGFASGDDATREQFVADLKSSVEIAGRVGAKWCTILVGEVHSRLEPDFQTANVIEALKRGAEVCEASGLVMVLEPLNWWRDHPRMFLWKIPQAYLVCKAVASPSCKILFDIYHQQISEGNLIPNMDHAWDEIGYFQIGDNPGRNEPGTGEINYRNVFRHIHAKGFEGVMGMEHGNSRPGAEGEEAVIAAYVAADDF